jgi:hypothetical protein
MFVIGKETPKKYVVFEEVEYYPSGGLHDMVDSFDTLDEAKTFAQGHRHDCHIVDRDTWMFCE